MIPEEDTTFKLTDRQLEILKYISNGHTNIEIGRRLNISSNTVKVHVANIYEKLDVTNRIQAALRYSKIPAETNLNTRPVIILELFPYLASKYNIACKYDKYSDFSLELQLKLMNILSNRELLGVVKSDQRRKEHISTPGYRLSGIIQKYQKSIHITAYLETYPQKIHLWSNTFCENSVHFNIESCAAKISASMMYNLILKESSMLMELQLQKQNLFQKLLSGFFLINLATPKSLIDAHKIFDSILISAPYNITALYGKCVAAYLTIIINYSKNPAEDYLIVKNCCIKISKVSKNCAKTYYMKGLENLLNHNRTGSIILFENAIRVDPSFQEGYLILAQLYTVSADYSNGEKYLTQVILLCPEYRYKRNTLISISLIYFCLGKYNNAIELLEESAYMQEKHTLSTIIYMCSSYQAGDKEKARRISKNMVVDRAYIDTLLSLADENLRNTIFSIFANLNITILKKNDGIS